VLLLIVVQKEVLKHALSRLPTPHNDYEIVVPDGESHMDSSAVDEDFIPDQSDVEANQEAELRAKSECIQNHEPFTVTLSSQFCSFLCQLSFFVPCREMLPSAMRPLVGPMCNPTSPNALKFLRGFCKPQKSTPMHVI